MAYDSDVAIGHTGNRGSYSLSRIPSRSPMIPALDPFKLTLCRWFILIAAPLSGCGPPPAPAQPTIVPPAEVASRARALPGYPHLAIAGVAFLEDRLFVATTIGLVEVQGREAKQVYSWYSKDDVIEGPWADEPRGSIWAQRAADMYFVRLDRSGWRRIDLPKPPDGWGYTRGDFLEGFDGISDAYHFHLLGAGHVWRWSDLGGWAIEPQPPAEKYSAVVGFADAGTMQLYVVRIGTCPLPPCKFAAYWRDGDQWDPPVPIPISDEVKQVVLASRGAFIRGSQRELLLAGVGAVTLMETPGPCEAITRTSEGKLLGSFRGAGIYVLEKGWVKLLDDPYTDSEGEHWAYLSENRGRIAFATCRVPHLELRGGGNEWHHSWTGTDALWVTEGNSLVRVELNPEAQH